MKNKVVRNFIFIILEKFIWILDWFIPKKDSNILFSSNGGNFLSGNSLSMFNFLSKKKKYNIKYFLNSPDESIYCISWKRLKDWKFLLTAKNIFLSHGSKDLGIFWKTIYKNNRNIINLWHGTPIKRMALLDHGLSVKEKKRTIKLLKHDSMFITCSETESITFMAMTNLKSDKFKVTGFPRNDQIFLKGNLVKLFKDKSITLPEYDKVILYAPTWRENNITAEFFPFDNGFDEIENFIENNKIIILIRGHINDSSKKYIHSKRVIPFNQDIAPEINKYMGDIDAVITDYSSIYIDYLLTDKAIAFIPYDLSEYIKIRGFLYNYDSITPGHKINSVKDFITFLTDLSNDNDIYRLERKNIKNLFHFYTDNNSCERIYNTCLKRNYF